MVDTRFSVSIQIMMTLAYHTDELMNSEVLAHVLKTNPTFVRKIVSRLVEAELVESFRGKGGGIKIAKDPKNISLKDIYLASTEEKPLLSIHKKPVTKECKISCCIAEVLSALFNDIEDDTKSFLAKKRLSDLMNKVSQ